MKFVNLTLFTLCAVLSPLVSCVVATPTIEQRARVPGADTPEFYLVSSSQSTQANLLPLRLSGGSNGYASLTGSGPIGVYYFYQGKFVGAQISTPALSSPALIGAIPISSGCSTYGPLGFAGSSSDKCAIRDTFGIQSNTENSQLGAKLVFNSVGGFYACGSGLDVWYKVAAGDGPTGCSPIDLYTVPVN
ncbi:hypothetical protein M413DRAFT_449124 [Hebeloma cylindrosporum]|uniref:Ubiquitin 3 binding protein But2 C-terminal domain-containing protein n=1 Tax=Hebeloma cylindrosporum TaxID=76867 RepID=A0A0C3BY78_HEBCY|nr:hypothetical protein M413DRAFT_449124 [Hebeloma cylindrosporum h7]